MSPEKEKLDALLQSLLNQSQIDDVKNDLAFADQLFEQSPPPSINPQALAAIHSKVHRKLSHKKLLRLTMKISTVAATLLIAALAGLHTLYPNRPMNSSNRLRPSEYASTLWLENSLIGSVGTDPIESELDDLARSVRAIQGSVYEPTDPYAVDLLEIQEIESLSQDADFWKG